MTSELLSQLDIVLTLSIRFNLDEDFVRRFMTCTLYSHGLDIAAQEVYYSMNVTIRFYKTGFSKRYLINESNFEPNIFVQSRCFLGGDVRAK